MVRKSFKKPHRARKKKSLFAKAAFWRSAFFVVAAGGSIWLVCFSPALEVKEVNVTGTQKIDGRECASFIEGEINKKIAFFDSKSILLLNLDQTKKELMAKFPQIQNIKIERQFPSKIFASVEERHGVAIFTDGSQKKYLVDNDGIIFEELGQDAPDLLQIVDTRGQDLTVGDLAIKKDLLNNLLRMKGGAQSTAQIEIVSAVVESLERINLQTKEGWYIYFSPIKDVDSQLLKLVEVVSDESFEVKRSNLEYVDIRFTRVYLKEKTAITNPSDKASITTEQK